MKWWGYIVVCATSISICASSSEESLKLDQLKSSINRTLMKIRKEKAVVIPANNVLDSFMDYSALSDNIRAERDSLQRTVTELQEQQVLVSEKLKTLTHEKRSLSTKLAQTKRFADQQNEQHAEHSRVYVSLSQQLEEARHRAVAAEHELVQIKAQIAQEDDSISQEEIPSTHSVQGDTTE